MKNSNVFALFICIFVFQNLLSMQTQYIKYHNIKSLENGSTNDKEFAEIFNTLNNRLDTIGLGEELHITAEVKKLLNLGVSPKLKTPSKIPLIVATEKNLLKLVKLLINAGAEIDAINNNGSTALLIACARRYNDIVKFLLKNGANPNIKNNQNHTALYNAINAADSDLISLLLQYGANPNMPIGGSLTPLMIAVLTKNINGVRILLENGADITLKDINGKKAIDYATNTDPIHQLLSNPPAVKKIGLNKIR